MTVEDQDGDSTMLPTVDKRVGFYAVYEPKEVIGRGASSVVRRCVNKETFVEYAVKIIDVSGETNDFNLAEQTRQETLREIEILRMCKGHPYIIQLIDSFQTPTFLFLVFPLCKRGELFDYLTEVVTISEKRTRIIMKQLLEAVEFIHKNGIVHRDLKPENILLDENLNVNLSDFGFAMILNPGEELVDLFGTPAYLAPEVFAVSMHEDAPGYRQEVDMWACGVIMYTLLVGAPPFWHRKQISMIRKIMRAEYTFGSPEWDDITPESKDLISKLLVIDPNARLTAKEALQHPFFKTETNYESISSVVNVMTLEVFPDLYYRLKSAVRTVMIALHKTPSTRAFNPRRAFRVAYHCVRFAYRLNFFYQHPPPMSIDAIALNPYGVKNLRKIIDASSFRIYGHWVKKGDHQNRAALFEHTVKTDWSLGFQC